MEPNNKNRLSSLSAGSIIRELLLEDENVGGRVTAIFPVVADNAQLPYIAYRRMSLEQTPEKNASGADMVAIEVACYTATYSEGVELAEAVRASLDGVQAVSDGLRLRSCLLANAEEYWEADAFVQRLEFRIRI